jgi:hypothetical protein
MADEAALILSLPPSQSSPPPPPSPLPSLSRTQLTYYDEQEANLERELGQRTLKIQMLKTALLQNV